MSDLLSNLRLASSSLTAMQTALAVTGQNIANADTTGYARRKVTLTETPTAQDGSGGGVTVSDISSVRDQLIEARQWEEQPAKGRATVVADSLSVVEAYVGEAGSSVDSSLSDFFSSLSSLESDPTSSTTRQTVVAKATALCGSINDMASELETARINADGSVRSTVQQINTLATKIAGLNTQIAQTGGTSSASTLSLQDDRTEAIKELSNLIDIGVVSRDDGSLDVTVANGQALVVGTKANAIGTSAGSDGVTALTLSGTDITSSVTSGELGGYLEVRDTLIPSYQDQLDTLAYTIDQQFNTANAGGYDLNGKAGGNFFASLSSVSGAAAALKVDSSLAADPSLIAASGTKGAAGDNTNAKAMVALQDAKTMDSGTATFADAWSQLTYQVGQDSSTAQADETSASEMVNQISTLRDSVSGVSLDEESADLIRFQRAYEASAKYFEYVNNTLDTLMSMLGS